MELNDGMTSDIFASFNIQHAKHKPRADEYLETLSAARMPYLNCCNMHRS